MAQIIPAQNNDLHVSSEESYGVAPYPWQNAMKASFFWMLYPQFTNGWCMADQGGANIGTLEGQNIEKRAIVTAQYYGRVFLSVGITENGGFSTTAMLPILTNITLAPGVVVEDSSLVTNTGYFATASNTWNFMMNGAIPDGDANNEARNNAVTNFAGLNGIPYCDMFHLILNNGFTDPVTGTNLFGFFAGGHPFPAGHAFMAFSWLMSLTNFNTVTNVNSCSVNFADGSINSTNHCVVTFPTKLFQTLSFTWHADRHSMAIFIPGLLSGMTTDCRDVNRIHPAFTNFQFETIQIPDAPDGTYNWTFDGMFVRTVTGAELRAGLNLFHEYNTQLMVQKMEVLGRILEQNGDSRDGSTEHSAGDNGVSGQPDGVNVRSHEDIYGNSPFPRGTTYISTASITNEITGFKSYDNYIWQAAQPTNHTMSFEFLLPRTLAIHR